MGIDRIHIKNFTVFSDFTIDFTKGINLLIGENGVGKTHLLKFLHAYSLAQERKKEGIHLKVYHVEELELIESNPRKMDMDELRDSIAAAFGINGKFIEEKFQNTVSEISFSGAPYPKTLFIPAKEMLSHSKGLLAMKKKYGEEMPFDVTLLDIIEKAQAWKMAKVPDIAKNITPIIEEMIGGEIEVKDDGSFWVKKSNGNMIPFSMEAEGLKRIGLFWQLIMNESINKDAIILWDEPEASINPENIPILVDIMLELQRQGVQIIAATHSYNLLKYFSIKRMETDDVRFFSLFKTENGTGCECKKEYDLLDHNAIVDGTIKMLEDEIEGVL